jgi:hypothetical protein
MEEKTREIVLSNRVRTDKLRIGITEAAHLRCAFEASMVQRILVANERRKEYPFLPFHVVHS